MKHKEYPSISRSGGQSFQEIPAAYVFDKLDGRNVSVTWHRKQGWQHFYTRNNRIFDVLDKDFGEAIPLFNATFKEPLSKIFHDARYEGVTTYFELYQQPDTSLPHGSLAGVFELGVPKKLALIDVAPYKQCILGPREFIDTFATKAGLPCASFLGQTNWTRGFVESVREGRVAVSFEGVVGKSGERHKLVMAKAKTQAWIDAVLSRYGADGQKIVES
jgi:hypothetical protein